MTFKNLVRSILPPQVLGRYRRVRRRVAQWRNQQESIEEVFTRVYARNEWGGEPGDFNSGEGTSNDRIVSAYIAKIVDVAAQEGFAGSTFVDLGCGDFRVGSQLLPLCARYVGVDVAVAVVNRNHEMYGNPTTAFLHLNIVADKLPEGDVCFVRQVLQHLSNNEILAILPKLAQYKWVIITEHYPSSDKNARPNIDKAHGPDIRLYDNSGVYLTQPPFNLPDAAIEQILEVPCDSGGGASDPGIIKTLLYKPHA